MGDEPLDAEVGEFLLGVLLVGGGIAVVLGLVGIAGLWYVVRRIRRSRRSDQLRRGIHRGRLTIRSVTADDVGRQLARLRLQVRRASEATERALAAAEVRKAPVAAVTPVVDGLRGVGEQLDHELRLAEAEPDPELRRMWTGILADKVDEHQGLCADLRRSLVDVAVNAGPDQLDRTAGLAMLEVEALNTWGRTYRSRRAA
ncbi:hypothetical protein GCM10023169_30970 [Georgenia halophila]|uniref:Secreted protein n=1 Tax=Georgenia halophila TaxID=620889 RepID=A0ABP8LG72_9MICO